MENGKYQRPSIPKASRRTDNCSPPRGRLITDRAKALKPNDIYTTEALRH
jgi:hypothetical protein